MGCEEIHKFQKVSFHYIELFGAPTDEIVGVFFRLATNMLAQGR